MPAGIDDEIGAPAFAIDVDIRPTVTGKRDFTLTATTAKDGILRFTRDAPLFDGELPGDDFKVTVPNGIGANHQVNATDRIEASIRMDCERDGEQAVEITLTAKDAKTVTVTPIKETVMVECRLEGLPPDDDDSSADDTGGETGGGDDSSDDSSGDETGGDIEPNDSIDPIEVVDGEVSVDEEGCVVFGADGGRVALSSPPAGDQLSVYVDVQAQYDASDFTEIWVGAHAQIAEGYADAYTVGVTGGSLLGAVELVIADVAGNPVDGTELPLDPSAEQAFFIEATFDATARSAEGLVGIDLVGEFVATGTSLGAPAGDEVWIAGRAARFCALIAS